MVRMYGSISPAKTRQLPNKLQRKNTVIKTKLKRWDIQPTQGIVGVLCYVQPEQAHKGMQMRQEFQMMAGTRPCRTACPGCKSCQDTTRQQMITHTPGHTWTPDSKPAFARLVPIRMLSKIMRAIGTCIPVMLQDSWSRGTKTQRQCPH